MKYIYALIGFFLAIVITLVMRPDTPQINTQAPASITAPTTCADAAGQHLNWVNGAFACGSTNSYVPLSGTSAVQNPGIMIAAACNNFTITVTGATTGQAVFVSPIGGIDVGTDVTLTAMVTSANTVTVHECVLTGLTPASAQFRAVVE